jgi:excisionase family DNA binding protein
MPRRSMGNQISVQQTASILGVSVCTVYHLRQRGFLKATGTLHQQTRFNKEEVYAYAEQRKRGERTTLEELHAQLLQAKVTICTLERRIQTLEFALGITASKIETSKDEILTLLWKAEEALQVSRLGLEEIHDWCKSFMGIHEEFFELVEHYAQHPEPWKPFLLLSQKAHEDCPTPGPDQDYDTVTVSAELEVARRNLRQAAWSYVAKRRGYTFAAREFPETDHDVITHLLHDHLYT